MERFNTSILQDLTEKKSDRCNLMKYLLKYSPTVHTANAIHPSTSVCPYAGTVRNLLWNSEGTYKYTV